MKRLFAFVLWFWPLTLFAANWYVRPSATGSKTGADWDNAWTTNTVQWSNVKPGDVIWLAGGTYSTPLTISGGGGNAANPIKINKVLKTDDAPSKAAGWSDSFDSQVVLSTSNSSPAIVNGSASFVTIDGRAVSGGNYGTGTYGIKITQGLNVGNGFVILLDGTHNNLKFYYIELVGGYGTPGNNQNWESMGFKMSPSSATLTDVLISHCKICGFSTGIHILSDNFTLEYSVVGDIQPSGNGIHPDLLFIYTSKNMTLRYNQFYNCSTDGIFFGYGGAVNLYFYGNVFWNNPNHNLWFDPGTGPNGYGPVHIYNNVFQAPGTAAYSYGYCRLDKAASGSEIYNNIFWNVSNGMSAPSDYNAYSPATLNGYPWPSNETHSFTFKDNPWVNMSAGNMRLTSAGAAIMANKGKSLATDGFINKDPDNNTRGADGSWDVGTFEASGSNPTPTPTTSPSATPTASPSVTPYPSPTATPPPTVLPSPKFKMGDWVKSTDNVNIRGTPSGTLMGSQPMGSTGKVVDGPQIRSLNGTPVTWWGLAMTNSPSGWVGEDYLAPSAAPTATPSPSPSSTPSASFHSWLGKVNTKISTDNPTEQQLNDWIKNNPAKAD